MAKVEIKLQFADGIACNKRFTNFDCSWVRGICTYTVYVFRGARRGRWEIPPPEPEKIAVEKLSYFAELYKMTKVLEDRIENG